MDPLTATVLAVWIIARYTRASIVAARGGESVRDTDREARHDPTAVAAHERRREYNGPTVRQALSSRIADWIMAPEDRQARREEKRQRRAEKPPPLLWLVITKWWLDVVEEWDYRREEKRLEKLNERRQREGLPVLDVEAEVAAENEVVEHWCVECDRRPVDAAGEVCPACEAAEPVNCSDVDPQPAATSPRSFPCARRCGHTNPYPDTICAYCVIAERQAPPVPQTPAMWPCRAGCGTPVAVDGTNCPTCQRRYHQQLDGTWCASCQVHQVDNLGDFCPLCAPTPTPDERPDSPLTAEVPEQVADDASDGRQECEPREPVAEHDGPTHDEVITPAAEQVGPTESLDDVFRTSSWKTCPGCRQVTIPAAATCCASCGADRAETQRDFDERVAAQQPPETPESEPAPEAHQEGIPMPQIGLTDSPPWHNCHGLAGHPVVMDTPGVPCPHCVVDNDIPELPEPTPASDRHQEGPTSVTTTENIDLNSDVHEASRALAYVQANDTWLDKVSQQYEVLANNARAGRVTEAVGAVDRLRAAIADCRGLVQQDIAKHEGHVAAQNTMGQNRDTAGISEGTYLGQQT